MFKHTKMMKFQQEFSRGLLRNQRNQKVLLFPQIQHTHFFSARIYRVKSRIEGTLYFPVSKRATYLQINSITYLAAICSKVKKEKRNKKKRKKPKANYPKSKLRKNRQAAFQVSSFSCLKNSGNWFWLGNRPLNKLWISSDRLYLASHYSSYLLIINSLPGRVTSIIASSDIARGGKRGRAKFFPGVFRDTRSTARSALSRENHDLRPHSLLILSLDEFLENRINIRTW